MARFVHRTMVKETVQIGVRIEKFSQVVVSRNSYKCVVFAEEGTTGGEWILEVDVRENDGEHYINIYLLHGSGDVGGKFVDLKLTIDDCFGLWGLSKKRSLNFDGMTIRGDVMSFRVSPFNRWWLLPDDGLTIRGEMTLYKGHQKNFRSHSKFQEDIRKSRNFRNAVWLIVWLCKWSCIILAATAAGYCVLLAVSHYVVFPFFEYVVIPFFKYGVLPILAFVTFNYLITCLQKKHRTVACPRTNCLWCQP